MATKYTVENRMDQLNLVGVFYDILNTRENRCLICDLLMRFRKKY